MKSLIVRLSVLAITTTGFAASTVVSHASAKKDVIKPVSIGLTTPVPMCTPGVCTGGLH